MAVQKGCDLKIRLNTLCLNGNFSKLSEIRDIEIPVEVTFLLPGRACVPLMEQGNADL